MRDRSSGLTSRCSQNRITEIAAFPLQNLNELLQAVIGHLLNCP